MEIPSNRVINKQRMQRFHDRISEAINHPEVATLASVIEQYRRKNESITVEQIAAALAVIANGEQPLLLKEDVKVESFFEERSRGRGRPERGERRPHGRDEFRRDDFDAMIRVVIAPNDIVRASDTKDHGNISTRSWHGPSSEAGNIVGAIANELGIDSAYIGRIEIHEEHSTVDFTEGMPAELFQVLKKVRVGGRKLNITRLAAGNASQETVQVEPVATAKKKVKKRKKKEASALSE